MDSYAATCSARCVHIFLQSIAMMSGVDDKDAKVWFADSDLSYVAIN